MFNDDRCASTKITIMSTALLSAHMDLAKFSHLPLRRRKYGSLREELNRWIGPCIVVLLMSLAVMIVVICALVEFVCCSVSVNYNASSKYT